ncbi:protein kinase, putative [Plasmodium vinckei brucechwatti]|uniref:Protein kinase, putative n=1 Tax=Plasmodium vinckei brucechwatti TaxID=119398 RepID=A0A6V7S2H6_PLAVN|nr:protein kinase, putative [Plasmodium vinckei brucechwatti]
MDELGENCTEKEKNNKLYFYYENKLNLYNDNLFENIINNTNEDFDFNDKNSRKVMTNISLTKSSNDLFNLRLLEGEKNDTVYKMNNNNSNSSNNNIYPKETKDGDQTNSQNNADNLSKNNNNSNNNNEYMFSYLNVYLNKKIKNKPGDNNTSSINPSNNNSNTVAESNNIMNDKNTSKITHTNINGVSNFGNNNPEENNTVNESNTLVSGIYKVNSYPKEKSNNNNNTNNNNVNTFLNAHTVPSTCDSSANFSNTKIYPFDDIEKNHEITENDINNNEQTTNCLNSDTYFTNEININKMENIKISDNVCNFINCSNDTKKNVMINPDFQGKINSITGDRKNGDKILFQDENKIYKNFRFPQSTNVDGKNVTKQNQNINSQDSENNVSTLKKNNINDNPPKFVNNEHTSDNNLTNNTDKKIQNNNNSSYSTNPGAKGPSLTQKDKLQRIEDKENYKSFLNVINKRMENFARAKNMTNSENAFKKSDCSEKDENISTRHEEIDKEKIENPKKHTINEINNYPLNDSKKSSRNNSRNSSIENDNGKNINLDDSKMVYDQHKINNNQSENSSMKSLERYTQLYSYSEGVETNISTNNNSTSNMETLNNTYIFSPPKSSSYNNSQFKRMNDNNRSNNNTCNNIMPNINYKDNMYSNNLNMIEEGIKREQPLGNKNQLNMVHPNSITNYTTGGDTNMGNENNSNMRSENGSNIHINNITQKNNSNKKIIYKDEFNINKGNLIDNINHGPIFNSPDNYTNGENCYNSSKEYFMNENINNAMFNGDYLMTHSGKKDPLDIEDGIRDENSFVSSDDFFTNPHGGETRIKDSQPFGNKIYPIMNNTGRYNNTPTSKENIIGIHNNNNNDNLFCLNSNKQCNQIKTYNNNNSATMETTDSFNNISSVSSKYNFLTVVSKRQNNNNNNDTNINSTLGTLNDCVKDGQGNRSNSGNCSFGDRYYSQQNYDNNNNKSALKNVKHCDKSVLKSVDKNVQHKNSHHKSFHKKFHDDLSHSDHYNLVNSISSPNIFSNVISTNYYGAQIGELKKEKVSDITNEYNKMSNNLISTPEEMSIYTQSDRIINEFAIDNNSNMDKNSNSNEQTMKKKTKKKYMFNTHGGENNCSIRGNSNKCNKRGASNSIDGASMKSADSGRSICSKLEGGTATMSSRNDYNNIMDDKLNGHMVSSYTTHNNMLSNLSEDQGGGCSTTCNSDIGNSIHIFNNINTIDKNSNCNKNHYITNMYYEQNFKSEGDGTYAKCNKDRNPIFCNTRENNNLIKKNIKSNVKAYFLLDKKDENINVTQNNRSNIMHVENNDTSRTTIKKETPFNEFASSNTHKYNDIHNRNSEFISSDNRHRINNNVKQVNLPIDSNSTTPDFSNISHINNADCSQDALQYSSTMFIAGNNTSNNNANENSNHCINPNRIGVSSVDEANYSSWKKVGGIGNVKGMEMNKYPYKNSILIDNNNNKNNNQINYMNILHDPVKYSTNNKQDVFINKYMDMKIKNMDDNMNIDYANRRFVNNNANLKNTPCNNSVSNIVMNPNYLLQGNGNIMFKNMSLGTHEYNMEMAGKPDLPVSVSPLNTNISNTIKENKNVISSKNAGAVKNVGANKAVHNFNFNLIEGNNIDSNNSKVNNLLAYKRNNGANNLLENNEKLNLKMNCPNEESNNSESHINNKNKIYTEANLKGIGISSSGNINRNTVANYKVNNILINDKLKNILLSKNFNNFLIGDENKIGIRNTINNSYSNNANNNTHSAGENEACTSSSTLAGLKNSNVLPGNNIPKLKEPYNYYSHLKNHIPPPNNNNIVNKKINEIPENNKLQDMNGIYSNYIEQGNTVINTKENTSINNTKEYNNKHMADISKSIGSSTNANHSLNYIESVYNIYPSSLLNAKNKIRRNGKPGANNFNENAVSIPSQQRQISQIENENKYYNNINTQEGNNKKIVNLNFQDMLIYKQNNLNIDEINKEKYDPIFNNYVNSGGLPSMNNKNIPRQRTNGKISNTPMSDINNNRNIVSKSHNSYQTVEDTNESRVKEEDLFSSLNISSKASCNDALICHQGNFQDKRTIVCGDTRMAKEKKINLLGTGNKNSVQVTCVSGVIGSIENNNVPSIYSNLANSNSYFQNRGPETTTKNTISYKPSQNNNNDMNSQAIVGLKNENKLINNGKGLIAPSNHNKRIDQTDDKKIENICNNKNEGVIMHDINKNKIYDIFLSNKKNYISNNNNNLYTNLNNNNNNIRSTIQNPEYFYSKIIQNNNLVRYNDELIKTIDRSDDVNPVDSNVISHPAASVSNTSPNLVKKEMETFNNNCISEKDLSYYKNVNYKNMDIDNYVLYHQQEKDISEKYLKNRNYISSDNNIKIESIQKQPNDHNPHILRNINMNTNIANNNLIINKGVIKNMGNIPDKSVNYYNENRYYYMNELQQQQQHSIIGNKYGPHNNENNSNLGGGTVLNTIGNNNKKEDYDENVFRISKSQFISLEKDIKYLQSLTLHNINSKDLYFEAYEEKEIFPYEHNGIEANPNYYFNNNENNNDYIFINDHGMNDSKMFNNTSVNDISNNGPGGCIKKEMKKNKVYTNKLNTSLKYTVIEEGSFGVVYKGWYKNMHVAVKVPVEKMVKQDPYGLTKRSINEWKILSKCEHPNIIKLYGGIIHSYFDIWLVTKLINGSDLHTIKNNMNKEERVLSTDISLKMCRQLAAVINFLHTPIKNKKNVIIHRDIKPENLIIDSDWNIHLCDFGDSEETEDGNVSNVSGATWIYAPPELLTCHPLKQSNDYNFLDYAQLSYKWDIWSMGCVFQEMMNLPSPFQHYIISFDESDQIYEKLVDVFTKKLPPCIHSKIDNSPFADIIKLCLNYDPNLRPTAKEIVDLLNQPNEYLLLKRR